MFRIIEILIPIFTLIIGLVWGELSRRFSNKYTERQTVNRAISILLELYFQIKRVSEAVQQSQLFIEWYLAQFKENTFSEEDEEIIRNTLSSTINPIVTEMASYDIDKINADYESVLKELSVYYPVDAYRLRGRNDIKNILTNIDVYYDSLKKQVPVSYDEYNSIMSLIKPIIQTQAIEAHLSAIRDEIETLSKEINCHQRKEILTALKSINADKELYEKNFENIRQRILLVLQERMPNLIQ